MCIMLEGFKHEELEEEQGMERGKCIIIIIAVGISKRFLRTRHYSKHYTIFISFNVNNVNSQFGRI